ncbi:MAG: hypothetical protein ACOVP2_07865 [Armatimonadaceae bacterium]
MRILHLAAIFALASSSVLAQQGQTGMRIRLGALQPSSASMKTVAERHPGVMIDFLSSKSADGSTLTVGYFQGGSGAGMVKTVPVMFSKVSDSTSAVPGLGGLYTGTGIGAYLFDTPGSNMKTLWGGYAMVGLKLPGGIFAETQYHYTNRSVNGYSPNGVGLMIGRKF